MRKLLDQNYNLRYSSFSLDDNDVITMQLHTDVVDGSPEKLYYGFKELATRADKQDDLLISEFSMLEQIDSAHTSDLPENEKAVKLKYLKKWTSTVVERVKGLDEERDSGAISYLLLNLALKIDYLISAEGVLMDKAEKVAFTYFRKDNRSG